MRTAHYDLHGVTVEVETAESLGLEALGAIDRRLRAFRSEPVAAPALRISVGDQPLSPPAGPSRPVYDSVAGPVRYHDQEGTLFAQHYGGAQLSCHASAGVAQLACASSSPDSVWLATHPLLTIALIELLKQRDRFNLHAACVASGGRGILITGPSGAGKTTLAVALARSGQAFMADDMVFLAPSADRVEVLGFPDEVDVTDQTMSMFGELRSAARPQTAGGGKWSLRLEDVIDAPSSRSCRPALLVVAHVANRPTSRVMPLAATEALVELVPNVLLTDPGRAQAHLATLAQLVASTPCVRLETGRDLDAVACLLDTVMDEHVP